MDCQYLSLAATGQFSSLFLDYLEQKPSLKPFYGQFPTLDAFAEAVKTRPFSEENRQTLVQVLQRQYAGIANKPDFSVLAQPNTFTVTTGHQLNIFTGPLYVIYKLISTVNLAKKLNEAYPEYRFVPVYWMATEDHDAAEINHFNLFGKTYSWTFAQQGAVGRFNPAELEDLLTQLPEKVELFEKAYLTHNTLADAVRYYVNELFGADGLVCLDADDTELKRLFVPVMQDELRSLSSGTLVQQTNQALEKMGYRPPVTPRELNLFYLDTNLRERIVKEGSSYRVLNTDLRFSPEEMEKLLQEHPERLSPNVVLRPVYQEVVLPNLAYIGGPSEVPYWMQLKGVFDHYSLPFPMLIPRNFAMYINAASRKRMEKLGVAADELFQDEVKLRRSYIERITENSLDLDTEKKCFEDCFTDILAKAVRVDKSLEGAVNAEKTKLLNAIENLEKRLKKAEERNHDTVVNQLMGLKTKLFPGGPQDRSENFLNYHLNDPEFISKLKSAFDPLDYRMLILCE
ncbi:bacillithiol biosynthesis cysteine-adding enzyme BshC [Tellurirhabdus rosea]|uniref:bacillithiol biosynthesis cysteine-adding enzyme BshC n=1 Tax=Tellurirhabdus rosea TaxID=2674997 RepID=UPI00225964F4|nr:bacillithiol biosynthesis cysteine-adding enzyme BshC [Tellurirhabdus rosea]